MTESIKSRHRYFRLWPESGLQVSNDLFEQTAGLLHPPPPRF